MVLLGIADLSTALVAHELAGQSGKVNYDIPEHDEPNVSIIKIADLPLLFGSGYGGRIFCYFPDGSDVFKECVNVEWLTNWYATFATPKDWHLFVLAALAAASMPAKGGVNVNQRQRLSKQGRPITTITPTDEDVNKLLLPPFIDFIY